MASSPRAAFPRLTRQQFEQLTGALQPADKGPVPPDIRRRFATQYAKLLTLSDAARELGLENDPKVQQIFTFARNQILAEALNQHYVEKYSHPTDQQIQEYYDQNKKKYRRGHAAAHHHPDAAGDCREAEARSGSAEGARRQDPPALGCRRRSDQAGKRSDGQQRGEDHAAGCERGRAPSGLAAGSA